MSARVQGVSDGGAGSWGTMDYIANFSHRDEFIDFYRTFSDDLPRRSEGRSKISLENWIFRRLCFILIAKSLLTFPLSVKYSDCPDYQITTLDYSIGVEITEAIGSNFARALKESEMKEVGMVEPGDFRRTNDKRENWKLDIKGFIDKDHLDAEPWEGDLPEQEWASRMKDIALRKVDKFKKYPDASSLNNNILLTFDVRPEPVRFTDLTEMHLSQIFESEDIVTTFRYMLFVDSEQLWIDVKNRTWELISHVAGPDLLYRH